MDDSYIFLSWIAVTYIGYGSRYHISVTDRSNISLKDRDNVHRLWIAVNYIGFWGILLDNIVVYWLNSKVTWSYLKIILLLI